MTTTTRALVSALVTAPIAYLMFTAFDQSTRIAMSVILAIVAAVFVGLFLRPPSR